MEKFYYILRRPALLFAILLSLICTNSFAQTTGSSSTHCHYDSVIWKDYDGYSSAHLYINELDTTVYEKSVDDWYPVKMNAHINSKESLACIAVAKEDFLKVLGSLSKQEKDSLSDIYRVLMGIVLERHGYVKKIIFTFYTSAKKHPSDAFIRQTDKAIRAIKFPPTTNYGINSNAIYMPIKKNELQQYLE